jgi:hypothetical protein
MLPIAFVLTTDSSARQIPASVGDPNSGVSLRSTPGYGLASLRDEPSNRAVERVSYRRASLRDEIAALGPGYGLASRLLPPRHDAVEVKLHFAIDDAADAFDETAGLVVFLAEADDLIELHAGRHGVGRLIDNLIAGVELRHDEVAGRPIGQHPAGVGIMIRPRTGKAR